MKRKSCNFLGKIVAIGLTLVMGFQATPMELWSVLAEELKEVFTIEDIKTTMPDLTYLTDEGNLESGKILGEDEEKRTETTKEYILSNGLRMVKIQ